MVHILTYLGLVNKDDKVCLNFIKYTQAFGFSDYLSELSKSFAISRLYKEGLRLFKTLSADAKRIVLNLNNAPFKKDAFVVFNVNDRTYKLSYNKHRHEYKIHSGKYSFIVLDTGELCCVQYKLRLSDGDDGHVRLSFYIKTNTDEIDVELEVLHSKKVSQRLVLAAKSVMPESVVWCSVAADEIEPIEVKGCVYKKLTFRDHYNCELPTPNTLELKKIMPIESSQLGSLAIGLYLNLGSKSNDYYPRFQAMSGSRTIDIAPLSAINGAIKSTGDLDFKLSEPIITLVENIFESFVLVKDTICGLTHT
jgi:hypothetical protein